MIVREAKRTDIDKLVALGIEFANVSQASHGFTVSEKKIRLFTQEIIGKDDWINLVLEDEGKIKGILAGVVNTPFFSEDILAQEVFWYVQEGGKEGLKLMFQFEILAKQRGCKKISFGYKPAFVDMKVIFDRMGYRLMESQYIKDVR